jgi:hypothetical protein
MAGDAINGAAAVYGPTGTLTCVGTWATSDTNKVNEVSLDMSTDKGDFKRNGIILGRRWFNVQHRCRVTITPTGATKAAALANIKLPDPGSAVVLATSLGSGTNTLFDGTWTFDGDGSVNVSPDGNNPTTITLNLWRVSTESSMTPAALTAAS